MFAVYNYSNVILAIYRNIEHARSFCHTNDIPIKNIREIEIMIRDNLGR